MSTEILTKKELADELKVSVRTIDRQLEGVNTEEVLIYQHYRAFKIGRLWRFQSVKETLTTKAA